MPSMTTVFRPALPGLLAVLCLVACKDEEPPGAPPPVKGEVYDASLTGRPARIDAGTATVIPPADGRLGELAGVWGGQAMTEEYGVVLAHVFVGDDGYAQTQVRGNGITQSEQLKIVSWDGSTIKVRTSDGAELSVPGSLEGSTLTLTLPRVGRVQLKRQANASELPKHQ
jgi:hypothetical protein